MTFRVNVGIHVPALWSICILRDYSIHLSTVTNFPSPALLMLDFGTQSLGGFVDGTAMNSVGQNLVCVYIYIYIYINYMYIYIYIHIWLTPLGHVEAFRPFPATHGLFQFLHSGCDRFGCREEYVRCGHGVDLESPWMFH